MKRGLLVLASVALLLGAMLLLLSPPPGLADDAVISANAVLDLHAPWSRLQPEPRQARWTLNDPAMQVEPWREFMRAEMQAGRLPLWNHLNGLGEPFLANPQTRSLYPPQWLFLLGEQTTSWAWCFYAFHVLLGGFGVLFLARRFEIGFCGSVLAGLSFACLGFNALWLLWPQHSTLAWLPWLLVTADRLYARLSFGNLVAAAAVLGVTLVAGHPETAFKSVVAAFLFVVGRHFESSRATSEWSRLTKALAAFGLAVLLAAGFAAVQIIPFLDYLQSSEALLARRDAVAFPPHADLAAFARGSAAYFAHLLSPDVLGDGLTIDRWWFTEGNHNEVAAAYCGVLVLFFAAFGQKSTRGRPWSLIVMGLFSLAVVLRVPGFYHLVLKIPGFDVGANSRFLAIVGLTLALLAGLGLDRLLHLQRSSLAPRKALFALLFVVGFAVALVITVIAFPPSAEQRELQRALLQRDAALLMTAGALVLLLYFMPKSKLMVLPLLVVILAFDIHLHARSRIPWTAAADLWPSSPVLEFLAASAGPETGRILAIESGFGADSDREDERRRNLPAATNLHYGLASIESYSAMQLRDEAEFTAAGKFPVTANGKLSLAWSSPALFDDRLLDLAAVRWLLVPGDWRPQAALPNGTEIRSEDGRLHVHRYAGLDGLVLERPSALARAFLVWEARSGGFDELLGSDADPAAVAFVPGEPPQLVAGAGRLHLVELRADRMELKVAIDSGRALLVTSDLYSDLWQVEVDGQARDLLRANGVFRAVVLEPGDHQVIFATRLSQPALSWGLVVTGLSFLLTLAFGLGRRFRPGRSTS